jgi:uncharacterized membrane protein YadS
MCRALWALIWISTSWGKRALTATLFLIGTSLSRKTLQAVGVKPFLQGLILWVIVGTASLIAIKAGWISI